MSESLCGYISWIGVAEDFLVKPCGKLATLWFDELILQVPTSDFVEFFLHQVPGEPSDPDVLRELERIWVPVHKYQKDYSFLSEPWHSDHQSLVKIVKDITKEEIKKESPGVSETDFAFRYDFAREGAGLLDTMNLWLNLKSKRACTFLPVWREHLVLQRLFSNAVAKKPFDLFSDIFTYEIPNLEAYPWERIIELRYHPFFESFRRKLTELCDRIELEGSKFNRDFVEKVIIKDMKEMIRLFRPRPSLTLVKAIVCDVPLPIPVNPFSILSSLLDLKQQRDISKKYGWLYFLLDLESEGSHKNVG